MTRNHLLDNAKYILILLVVFGHMIEPLIDTHPIIKVIYLSIYSFHMPAFVVIAGMLSKAELGLEQLTKLISSIFIPFIVFTVLYEFLGLMVTGSLSGYTINLQPYWILWFLYSLFLWKIFLPIILNFKFPILIAFIIAVAAGYAESIGYYLGLSRTLYFFPFFILGYKLTPKYLSQLKIKFNSNFYIVMFIGVLLLNLAFFSFFHEMQHQWLYGSYSYSRLESEGMDGPLKRTALYLVSLVTVMTVLLLIPDKKIQLLSKGGGNSLYVYVWHGFFVKIFVGTGIVYVIGSFSEILSLVLLFVISAVLMLVLSSNFIMKFSQRFIMKPIHNLLLKQS